VSGEVGIQPSKGLVDSTVGNVCVRTRDLLLDWQQIYLFFVSHSDAELLAIGYDSQGISKARAIQGRAYELTAALTGSGTISVPHDYREEMSQWWGMGINP
jgi:hypothetical protein